MEKTDLELIEKWKELDPELSALWNEHVELEDKLDELNKRVYLSTEEQLEQKALKKKKLQGKTQIERILIKLRKDG